MDKVVLTVDEVAEVLGIARPNAYALAKSQGFPTVRIGRRMIIPVNEFYRWLSEQSRQGIEVR